MYLHECLCSTKATCGHEVKRAHVSTCCHRLYHIRDDLYPKNFPNQTFNNYPKQADFLGPYTERIYLWFEPFFVKEIMRVIEWLREIKTDDQHCYKFFLKQQKKFKTQWKLIINNVEIISCKLELLKKSNNWFHKSRDQRWKGEINNLASAIVSAPKTDKITIHDNMEPRIWIASLQSHLLFNHYLSTKDDGSNCKL